MTTVQQTVSQKRFRGDPNELESAYFRWSRSETATWAIAGRAERILQHHFELAEQRTPGQIATRLYRAGDPSGLGVALQIVNDDMPLLVESVTSRLSQLGAAVTGVVHPVFEVTRDVRGLLRDIAPRAADERAGQIYPATAESWMHIELAAPVPDELLDRIEREIPQLLAGLRAVDEDTPAMTEALIDVAERLERTAGGGDDIDFTDYVDLLRWLADGHFTVLGYTGRKVYPALADVDTDAAAQTIPDTGLGVLRAGSAADIQIPAPGPGDQALRMANGSADSAVPGASDLYFVSVVESTDPAAREQSGEDVPPPYHEHIFVGTLTVTALHEDILDIPVISRRVHQVIETAGFDLNSFSGQGMLEVMQSVPRAELFTADFHRLFETVSAVVNLGLRRQVRLFLREDSRSGAVYCLVYMPNDRYSNQVRLRMQDILRCEFQGRRIGYSARVTESDLAVVYITVHRDTGTPPADLSEENRQRIQDLLFATTRTWADRLESAAGGTADLSRTTIREYAAAFPAGYQQEFEPERGLSELRRLERLEEGAIGTALYREAGGPEGAWRFVLYVAGEGVSLSRVLPVLHSLGVEVVDERPYPLVLGDGRRRWIYDFTLRVPAELLRDVLDSGSADLGEAVPGDDRSGDGLAQRFQDAVEAMWFGAAEVDGLNELVLRAGLRWRQVTMLRAYAKYLKQSRFGYGIAAITRVLLANPMTVRGFVELFEAYFDPAAAEDAAERARETTRRLEAEIDAVTGLDTDRVLRAVLALISATLRTSYFRCDEHGAPLSYLSVKFDPQQIEFLPQPRPRYEIFVYSPRMEGVHLRFGSVARGGLRWSDRLEDFRTEILGLVKAQAVKNAVIVPVGAKGGFVVKRPPAATGDPAEDRRNRQAEGVACYRMFIAGLLDITDNLDRVSGAVLPPENVVRRDGDDPYLVVAADKGTATFSDIANEVAAGHGFWLGDAFASGGSVGYDHKAMGITAKGAWESVKRHFAEMDIDTQKQDFTVVGVGDMSGDVFGNGMLLSEHIRLVAAFDHRHIFLDPEPDAARSYRERERLFGLSRSSWADYDQSLISTGGGVFDRNAKAITITPEIRQALGLEADVTRLSPPEVIRAILTAPVDLLWNGGIGTYIKASSETHADVGDKSNDTVRVNADELRVKVIGEGGNLGATSLGRIEFCRGGGRMNTDALDNSAGVDCSDHEVNIKILLDTVVSSGELPAAERNPLLAAMTDEVAALVLRDNVSQNFRMGLSRTTAEAHAAVHRRLLTDLENNRGLDRRLEALPADAEMKRRIAAGSGLASAELATLMAHVKLGLKTDVLAGDLPENPAFAAVLAEYFPTPLRDRFAAAIDRHRLRREIIATVAVNELVDYGGLTFAFQLTEEVGATTEDALRAFTTAVDIFGLRPIWQQIRNTVMPTAVRDELELEAGRTLARAARWLLLNRPQPIAIGADIARYRAGVQELAARMPQWLPEHLETELTQRAAELAGRGAPADLAREVLRLIHRFPLLDIADIADIAGREPVEIAGLYFALSSHYQIDRLLTAVGDVEQGQRWPTLARLAVRDDLYESLRLLTLDIAVANEPGDAIGETIAYWESTNRSRLARATASLAEIFAGESYDLATLSVAVRQVRSLVGGADPGAVAMAGAS
ncbi:NAD-glutamate dehydrogenase [Nocardia flavorosea]|uniref:NAD-glutamate dehydrogenase n=1 Tax=Nocardia flavorosea TaxID=53429 RepID=A0A846YQI0_9NOCA|nr:NAD-glutamate dehydrogenase [Nocardia flavorosea]NKY59840.1 NAD-glutamate dehydrogenase [Nocardia flavorosea]